MLYPRLLLHSTVRKCNDIFCTRIHVSNPNPNPNSCFLLLLQSIASEGNDIIEMSINVPYAAAFCRE